MNTPENENFVQVSGRIEEGLHTAFMRAIAGRTKFVHWLRDKMEEEVRMQEGNA